VQIYQSLASFSDRYDLEGWRVQLDLGLFPPLNWIGTMAEWIFPMNWVGETELGLTILAGGSTPSGRRGASVARSGESAVASWTVWELVDETSVVTGYLVVRYIGFGTRVSANRYVVG